MVTCIITEVVFSGDFDSTYWYTKLKMQETLPNNANDYNVRGTRIIVNFLDRQTDLNVGSCADPESFVRGGPIFFSR